MLLALEHNILPTVANPWLPAPWQKPLRHFSDIYAIPQYPLRQKGMQSIFFRKDPAFPWIRNSYTPNLTPAKVNKYAKTTLADTFCFVELRPHTYTTGPAYF